MMKVTKTAGGTRVDPGVYRALILDVKLQESKDPKKDDYYIWKLKFKEAVTFNGKELDPPVTINALTGSKWTSSKKNNLNKLLLAAGINAEEGESIDLEELVTKAVRIVVEDNDKDDVTYSKVVSFMPLKKTVETTEDEEVVKKAKPVAKGADPVDDADLTEDADEKPQTKISKEAPKAKAKPAPKDEDEDDSSLEDDLSDLDD